MKKLLLLASILLLFFLIPKSVFASDLEVSCGTSYCTLSTHDPIFPPEAQWTAGKIESKEVLISNTDTGSKEIFVKARNNETSTNELDSYMNITLLDGNVAVWQGTLADFINAGNIQVVNLGAGDDFTLEIEAEMAAFIPNDMQGKSSVFNFSFGFVGENKGEDNSSDTNGTGADSSSDESSDDFTSSSDSYADTGFFGSFFARAFGAFEDIEAVSSVAGEKSNVGEKEVMGAGVSICRENYIWILLLISQLLFGFILLIKRFEKRLKLFLATHSILFGITALAIYLLSCVIWPILISITIFITPVIWISYKKYKTSKV